ncbi:hypothetical protein LPB87_03670 [Flavobacterium sp. EDS]|uniref:hypothetical protein n=1 Tax=Flavobacterium sp. EDS TaxID=2897328 RepID=UPI001E4C2F36|nr:hypothetical protein [Flavobacterium sp. EDS]MCD0473488.1 hypothetical protein [Flavobacterium sp. EDS]
MIKYLGFIIVFVTISCNKVQSQKITIFKNDGEDIENFEDYPLNEIVLNIPANEKYNYVKIKSIEKVINEKNQNLVYERDSINRTRLSFPSGEFVQVNKEDAKLNFWIKGGENKNIKLIKGVLSYLKKINETEVSFSLKEDVDKNLVSDQLPFKIFRVNKSVVEKYRKKGQENEAIESGRLVDVVEKDDKFMTDTFGSQVIDFTTNQIVFWIEANMVNLIDIKFFDKDDNEIKLSEDQNDAIITERGLYAFYFDQKPQKDWKIKIYHSNKGTLVEVPFEVK